MNYRHQFHAGNFADVMKHAVLVRLVRELQKKPKGFLYLDTHAGRGRYDLASAAIGDSLARKPEWPDGIGRLWSKGAESVPTALREYLAVVREFDRGSGNLAGEPRFYPGSPAIVRALVRSQDRMVLCEKHPAECSALRGEFGALPRVSVHETDGYAALRATLPPPERRALVLIDPPYEAQDEYSALVTSLKEGIRRLPSGVLAIWYPLTERARVDEFIHAVVALEPPPTLALELAIAGETAPLKMRGCGVLVINPPWQLDLHARPLLTFLADALAQAPGAAARVEWIVRERPAAPRR